MLFFLQSLLLVCSVYFVTGGSVCPQRSDIYPCICINNHLGRRKTETTLVCHNLEDDDSLLAIEPALTNLEIDKFLLYDSFWRMSSRTPRFPVNIFNQYKIKEIEIVDSMMNNFACPSQVPCGLNFLKRLSSINSTVNDGIACNNQGLAVNSWVSCAEIIEFLEISRGIPPLPGNTLKPDFFPEPLLKLRELHLPYNKISRIDQKTFTSITFPALLTLNLSYNSIKDVRGIFSSPMKLKHIDLSHNNIRGIFENFGFLPYLETLNLAHTHIQILPERDWKLVPATVKHIDFSANLIKCGCSEFQWFNSTIPIHTALSGKCASPPEVQGMLLRRASRALVERCDENGTIGSRKKKQKRS